MRRLRAEVRRLLLEVFREARGRPRRVVEHAVDVHGPSRDRQLLVVRALRVRDAREQHAGSEANNRASHGATVLPQHLEYLDQRPRE